MANNANLTGREAKVYTYYGVPFTVKQLANGLGCVEQTVRNRFEKYEVDTEADRALRGWKGIEEPDLFALMVGASEPKAPDIDRETAEAAMLKALGFDPFDAPAVEETVETEEDVIEPEPEPIVEEKEPERPGSSTEDWVEELRAVNAAIRALKNVCDIDGFGVAVVDTAVELKRLRGERFAQYIDWDALAR